ncbi:transcriptional regulator [Dickeya fangzhongdai]|uniref:transcriptional regulator n=1 Tax=Dickeya fangzhongdai TaxID=1778540 RepID=UPI001ADBE6FB|nr:helix-turn-helix domain-containing protein [Dickeya fangzhongdai]MBO8132485.1 helix-turn-helix domain-containing protein [Dickeya fangzhongdai]
MINKVIEKAISMAGSQKKLAQTVGVSQPTVWRWLHGKKRVSPENVPAIVKATGGAVEAYELRPDLPAVFKKPRKKS